MRRFVAPAATTLGEVLASLGCALSAVAEGRVFVGRIRARSAQVEIAAGVEISIAAPRPVPDNICILHKGDGLVVVDKPAGTPTIPDGQGSAHTLLALTAGALGLPAERLHPTSRLDRGVSGLVIFALDKEARDRLALARSMGLYRRRYVALSASAPEPERGGSKAPLGPAHDPRLRRVDPRGKPAESRWVTVERVAAAALLALSPVTGRTHQLRVHSAHAGAPLLGDRSYGGPSRLVLEDGRVLGLPRIYLHCARISVPSARGGALDLAAPVPLALVDVWFALGGGAAAWEIGTAWDTVPDDP